MQEDAKDEDKYGDIVVEVYAPKPYYKRDVKPDNYSYNVVTSKSRDLSHIFYEDIKSIFESIKGKAADLICIVPGSKIDSYSPTLIALAERLSKEFNVEFENILNRKINLSKKMALCSNAQERYNVNKDTIGLNRALQSSEKKIILLDDVKTGGYTKLECAKILTDAGASKVKCICLGINK